MNNRYILILVISLTALTPLHAEQALQSLDSIYAFVKTTLADTMASAAENEITVLPLDNQLQLPECAKPLEVFKANEQIKAGRVSIGVRCSGDKKWSIFVSAIIKIYESVIVLTRPVQRGEIITRQHLGIEKKDISVTRGEFVTDFSQVENQASARNLSAGSILGLKSVVMPPLIKRKDKVIIRSGQPGVAVQMSGTALMDGLKDQLIRVKNDTSGRVVSGTVVESGVVLVK